MAYLDFSRFEFPQNQIVLDSVSIFISNKPIAKKLKLIMLIKK
jgi:hypothetical protein